MAGDEAPPTKPLVVGELNPHGADPRYALYHLPRGAMSKLPQGVGSAMMAIARGALDKDEEKVRKWVRVLSLALDKTGEDAYAGYFDKLLRRAPGEHVSPRFAQTICSQCGTTFGPGDHGFSHCEDHKRMAPVPSWQEVW